MIFVLFLMFASLLLEWVVPPSPIYGKDRVRTVPDKSVTRRWPTNELQPTLS